MADETKQEEAAKTVADIDSRRTFKTVDEALAYIGEIGEYVGFGDLQQAIVGAVADDDGNVTLDPAIYDDSMEIAVAIVSEKVAGAKMKPIALAVYPTPSTDAVLATDEGKAWIAKLVEKEANLVAMRALRKSDNIEESAAAMPTTIASYITPSREAATGILATYEAVWKDIKQLMAKKSRAWAIANFSKKELRRALESASYASGTYPKVEKGGGESSLFVFAIGLGQLLAKKADLDPAFFDNALAKRNEHVINIDDEDGELTLDDLLAEAAADEGDESNDDATADTGAEGNDADESETEAAE